MTGESVVAKYGYYFIRNNEIISLKKTKLYIAHMRRIVLMHKARGVSYEHILKNKSISDEIKIEIHKKIVSELVNLNKIYGIIHGDAQPKHIFIEFEIKNDYVTSSPFMITFIDFGNSDIIDCNLKNNCDSDINYFNEHVRDISSDYCGKLFNEYIIKLLYAKSTKIHIILLFLSFIFIASKL